MKSIKLKEIEHLPKIEKDTTHSVTISLFYPKPIYTWTVSTSFYSAFSPSFYSDFTASFYSAF
jgi:hypothetical protein